ncbi:MAG: hypothetical protein E7070_11340 [Bacteroidales bacterium]|nr:hypothetical protein [Bacteroidales bacterium]
MALYGNVLEEELKNKVAADWFPQFDCTSIIGRIDFCVGIPADEMGLNEFESLFWAEAKKGTSHDIYESFIQLILTLGKERPQDTILPPAFLGAFDAEKIAFLPYSAILDVLRQNDFNWNVAPSNHATKEFQQLKRLLADEIQPEIYNFEKDEKELRFFISKNFTLRKQGVRHIRINKNNFTHIYYKWLDAVKPSINIDWEVAKHSGIINADFYLADILSKGNSTLNEKLFVLLQDDHYLLDRRVDDLGLENFTKAQFNDHQKAHTQFWSRYARPPRREYWDYIVNRRDLLVPQDVRERKGAYFTPQIWVELSQQYLADELGENWQNEYYVWDCCAGTGNLLKGLTNKYNIYASTLEKADVQVMLQRIENMDNAARDKQHGGSNLLENHVFQFDFLNDPFFDETDTDGNVVKKSKLPKSLQEIISDPEKRRKLVIYINPPYAEAGNEKTSVGTGENKCGVSKKNMIYDKYKSLMGKAQNEIYALFLIRVYIELKGCLLGEFSKLKHLNAPNFEVFRNIFTPKLEKLFVVPGNTFDNVRGDFPIGFFVWDTAKDEMFSEIKANVYSSDGTSKGMKSFYMPEKHKLLSDWIRTFYDNNGKNVVGYLTLRSSALQNSNYVTITSEATKANVKKHMVAAITTKNLIEICMYLSVRQSIEHTWLNDRDQFLYPNDGWKSDAEFQCDCLVYTLFHGQNRISSDHGVKNHWIPFTEEEVGAQEKFDSHFMSDFLHGKIRVAGASATKTPTEGDLFAENDDVVETFHETSLQQQSPFEQQPCALLQFSHEAIAVMDAGRELWHYFHAQPIARTQPNASFYDIRLYFQGTKMLANGKQQMNLDSTDETYTALIGHLRAQLKALAKKIEPKVYEYGFLK